MSNFRYVRTSKTSNIFLTKVSFRPKVSGGGDFKYLIFRIIWFLWCLKKNRPVLLGWYRKTL